MVCDVCGILTFTVIHEHMSYTRILYICIKYVRDIRNLSESEENVTKKVRILDVVYNATSNELVRTKTLLKNTIVQIDAHPPLGFVVDLLQKAI